MARKTKTVTVAQKNRLAEMVKMANMPRMDKKPRLDKLGTRAKKSDMARTTRTADNY